METLQWCIAYDIHIVVWKMISAKLIIIIITLLSSHRMDKILLFGGCIKITQHHIS